MFSKTHGMSNSPEYRIWGGMWQRCTNQKGDNYSNYGGRGIQVCERWRSFENFISDMGCRPSSLHMLERKNNDGHYCPENCAWVTRKEQNRNTRQNRYLTHDGKTLTAIDWAEFIGGISGHTIRARLDRGWPLEEALFTPVPWMTRSPSRMVRRVKGGAVGV